MSEISPGSRGSQSEAPPNKTTVEQLKTQLAEMELEKKQMTGKLQGYKVIASLYQESRQENRKLQGVIAAIGKDESINLTDLSSGDLTDTIAQTIAGSEPNFSTSQLSIRVPSCPYVQSGESAVDRQDPQCFFERTSPTGDVKSKSSSQSFIHLGTVSEEIITPMKQEEREFPQNSEPQISLSMSLNEDNFQPTLDKEDESKYTRIVTDVMKMERRIRVQHKYIQTLKSEIQHLKSGERESKLKTEIEELRTKLERSEKNAYGLKTVDTEAGGWIQVTKETMQNQGDDGETKVVAISEIESNLRRANQQLKSLLDQYQRANSEWEKHWNRNKLEYDSQIVSLTRKLAEIGLQEEIRQADINNMLLASKRKFDEEHLAKETALSQVHLLTERGEKAKQEASVLRERINRLEMHLKQSGDRMAAQSQLIDSINAENRHLRVQFDSINAEKRHLREQGPPISEPIYQPTDDIDQLQSQVKLLDHQAKIYKEDFETERRDRESCNRAKEEIRAQLYEKVVEMERTSSKLKEQEEETKRYRADAEKVKEELKRTAQELQRLQETVAARALPGRPPHNQTTSILNKRRGSWPCKFCTYRNISARMSCEMCGALGEVAVPSNEIPSVVEQQQHHEWEREHRRNRLIPRGGVDECDESCETSVLLTTGKPGDIVIDSGDGTPLY